MLAIFTDSPLFGTTTTAIGAEVAGRWSGCFGSRQLRGSRRIVPQTVDRQPLGQTLFGAEARHLGQI